MIEIDAQHTPYEVTDLDAGCLLTVISEDRLRTLKGVRRQLRLAHQWCVVNPVVDGGSSASWCDDPSFASLDLDDFLGGEGTPAVAAFAAEEFAAASGISRYAALSLLADALDLHHRLPLLWAQVELLEVPGWKARRVAELTRKLSREAAAWFDQTLADSERYGWPTIERTLAMAVAKFHPDLIRDKNGPLTKRDWNVTLTHKHGVEGAASGTSTLDVVGDSLDLARFHDLVCEEAERLKRAGDTDTLGQRKAKALGSIAEQQDTLDFGPTADRACRDHHPTAEGLDKLDHRGSDGLDGATADRACRDHHPAADRACRDQARSRQARPTGKRGLRVFVHTTLAGLLDPSDLALAETDRLGPILVAQLEDWLKRHGSIASITPVVDLNRTGQVDRHDPPQWMVEQVRLRDQHCVFPHCTRSSADADLDHIDAYDAGSTERARPPGQTRPENLAPLCRRHHLAKTFAGWRYRRTRDGNYAWTNNHGNTWLVTPLGTIQLE